MELRHLRYFVAVAEELHFGRAAQRLHIVQSALSNRIIELERELGAELFERAKGVKLTPAGEEFYGDVHILLERFDRAVEIGQATARGELGSVAIGFVTPAMWSVLPRVLREYRRNRPKVRFELHDLSPADQFDRLVRGSLDVGFVSSRPREGKLVFEPVWRERYGLALSDEHPLAQRPQVDLGELADASFVIFPREKAPLPYELLISTCRGYGFRPRTVVQGNSGAALNMIAMGICVGLIGESFQGSGLKGVAYRPLTRPTPEIDISACYRRGEQSPHLLGFLDTMRRIVPTIQGYGRPLLGSLVTAHPGLSDRDASRG